LTEVETNALTEGKPKDCNAEVGVSAICSKWNKPPFSLPIPIIFQSVQVLNETETGNKNEATFDVMDELAYSTQRTFVRIKYSES
jgi:hypothetical protein